MGKILRELKFLAGKILGHKNYHKLVIVSRSRSGSNLLCSYLDTESRIFMWREVFRGPQYFTPSFTERWLFGKYSNKINLVGIKVFYYHKTPQDFWNRMVDDANVIFIHLVRTNYLSTYISLKEAIESEKWQAFKEVDQSKFNRPIAIDTHDMIAFLKRNEQFISTMEKRLNGRPNTLQLSYDELTSPFGKEILANFLSPYLPNPQLGEISNKQQGVRPLWQRISNFTEVEQVLKEHGYGTFISNT